MIKLFPKLTSTENDLLFTAPLLVGMLIAGADGIINSREQNRLKKVLYAKSRKYGDEMEILYQKLINNLNIYLIDFMHSYPRDPDERNREIVRKLGQLNDVLPKLDRTFAADYYHSLRDIARKTARASGKTFSIHSIRKQEKKFVLLSMIVDPGPPNTEKARKNKQDQE